MSNAHIVVVDSIQQQQQDLSLIYTREGGGGGGYSSYPSLRNDLPDLYNVAPVFFSFFWRLLSSPKTLSILLLQVVPHRRSHSNSGRLNTPSWSSLLALLFIAYFPFSQCGMLLAGRASEEKRKKRRWVEEKHTQSSTIFTTSLLICLVKSFLPSSRYFLRSIRKYTPAVSLLIQQDKMGGKKKKKWNSK